MVVKPIILCVIVRKHKNHKIGYMKNEELRKCHIDINKKGSYIKIIRQKVAIQKDKELK